ncbi:MAG: hydroxymethylbilane synthase [Pseudomonadota bacterium]
MILRIGTRRSKLALAQSEWVRSRIEAKHPHVRVKFVKIKTMGDKIVDAPLSKIGGKGLFVKEIEEALLRKEIDLAVHSMKDVPAELPEDLTLAVFPEREDPRDAFISIKYKMLKELPRGASIGTSSLRRSAQLLHMRPDLDIRPLRGNVDTRLRKLEEGGLHAIILATAGLKRLGFADQINQLISEKEIIPAIGQGALGLEVRRGDVQTSELISFMNHEETEFRVRAERAFLKELEGGCQVPMAAFCRSNGKRLYLSGMVAELDGSRMIRDEITGPMERAQELGVALARRLIDAGADHILARIYKK